MFTIIKFLIQLFHFYQRNQSLKSIRVIEYGMKTLVFMMFTCLEVELSTLVESF